MSGYDGPDRRDGESVEVLAERLDNHLIACEEQNRAVLHELRELRQAVQPVIDAYTTGRGIVFLLKAVGYIAIAVGALYAGFRFLRGA